nr:AlpA family transcriptional regulator [Pelomonas sp. KK5]
MQAQAHDPAGQDTTPQTFLRMPSVLRMTSLGRSTIYRLISEGKFPRPVRIGDRAVAWRQTDLDSWSETRQLSH